MILVDSSTWINYFNGVDTLSTNLLDKKLSTDRLLVGDLILTEVLQGFRSDHDFNTAKKILASFEQVNLINQELALKSAKNYRTLRAKGLTVRKTIDVIIATFCIENFIELLHDDKDFLPMQQYLKLQIPSSE